jgi:hypothetical protein
MMLFLCQHQKNLGYVQILQWPFAPLLIEQTDLLPCFSSTKFKSSVQYSLKVYLSLMILEVSVLEVSLINSYPIPHLTYYLTKLLG